MPDDLTPEEEVARRLFSRLTDDAMQGAVVSGAAKTGVPIHCEVDVHTAAALIAVQDSVLRKFKACESFDITPADPRALTPMILSVWAEKIWALGRVGPEHHDLAARLSRSVNSDAESV